MLYGKEQKGPVSALTQVNGYLVSAIGQKVSSNSDMAAHVTIVLCFTDKHATKQSFVLPCAVTRNACVYVGVDLSFLHNSINLLMIYSLTTS